MKTLKRLLSIALLWLGIAAFAQAAAPTAADFARRSKFETAKISPAGDYIAVTFWRDDVIALGVVDLKTMKIASTIWFSHGQHVADYWWASDRRVVMALGRRDGMLDQPRLTGELYGMDADGSHKLYLYGYQGGETTGTHIRDAGGATKDYGVAKMIDVLPGDPDHVLIAVNHWGIDGTVQPDRRGLEGTLQPGLAIESLDVRNAQRRRISYINTARGASSGWDDISIVADDLGQPRYAVVSDEQGAPVEMKRTPDDGWVVVRRHERTARVRLSGIGAGKVYMLSDEGGDVLCARARDLATSALETLSCADGVDAEPAFTADDGRPVALNFEDGRPLTQLLDDKNSPEFKSYDALLKAFPSQRVVVTSHSSDGRKLVALVDSDRNPGDFYLFDTGTMRTHHLFSRADRIAPERMTPVLPIEVKARDGVLLHGYVTSRGGLKPERRPLVLLVHGGPHGPRDRWEWQAEPQYLASLGYAVLQVNYRGSGGYGRNFMVSGYRHWADTMQDDLTDAVRWATAAGIADGERICIMGGSWGGYAAMMSPVREPALYRCAIELAGPVDLVTQASDSDTADYGFGRQHLRDSLGDNEARRKSSPITSIENLRVPVLIAHGTNDRRVPFSQARELRAALDRLHKPYEWLPFEGEEHGFYVDANREKYLLAVKAFLEKNIGPGIPGVVPEAEKK